MRILTISSGKISRLLIGGDGPARHVKSAINKAPISELAQSLPVYVGPLGIEGDEQADITVHGGAAMAIYAYPVEHYPFWENLLTQNNVQFATLPHGFFGENLTIEGLNEKAVFQGDIWKVGEVELMVEKLREPCFKFDAKIGFKAGPSMILSARSGWYLRVIQSGVIKAGDKITVSPGDRQISIADQNVALKLKRKL